MDEVDAPPDPRHVKEYHYLSREERQKIQKRIVSTNVQVAILSGSQYGCSCQ